MEISSSEWRMRISSSHHHLPNSVYRYMLFLIYVQEVLDPNLGSEMIMTSFLWITPGNPGKSHIMSQIVFRLLSFIFFPIHFSLCIPLSDTIQFELLSEMLCYLSMFWREFPVCFGMGNYLHLVYYAFSLFLITNCNILPHYMNWLMLCAHSCIFTLLFTVKNCTDRNLENDLHLESLHFKSECTTVHTDITLILFKFKSIVNYTYFFFTFTENNFIKRKLF